jgi:hypothetical protein
MVNQSEVARMLEQIETEYQAAYNALHGLSAGSVRHDFINARMERMAQHHIALVNLVGEQEAARILVENDQKAARHGQEAEHGDC